MLKAIVFDLDDTLYPERSFVFSGFKAVSRWADEELGIPFEQVFSELTALLGNGLRGQTFNAWLKLHGLAESPFVQQMITIYRQHKPDIVPYAEVPEVLSSLVQRYELGLVSDGYLEVQQKKWKALDLERFFTGVVFSDQWGRRYWKPHNRPFHEVLTLCGAMPSESVYVGDNPGKDFLGARQTGMFTIRFRSPEGIYHAEEPSSFEYAPHQEIHHFKHLVQVVTLL